MLYGYYYSMKNAFLMLTTLINSTEKQPEIVRNSSESMIADGEGGRCISSLYNIIEKIGIRILNMLFFLLSYKVPFPGKLY